MSDGRQSFVVSLLFWFLAVSVRQSGGDVGALALLSARCKAKCLTDFGPNSGHTRSSLTEFSKKGTNFLDDCRKMDTCSSCVRPCGHTDISTSLDFCNQYCQVNETECLATCGLLKQAHSYKPGSCRAPETVTGFEAACIQSCTKDADCTDNLKCCSNGPGCGFTCQQPDKLDEDIPKIPQSVQVVEKRQGRAVMITWQSSKPTNGSMHLSPATVIYVLQSRQTLGNKPSWGVNTPWEIVIQTTRRNYLVRNILAGHWYQFRLAAVVAEGTSGFTNATKPYKSSRDIEAPSPPQNLTDTGFTVHDGKIDLNVTWLKPSRSDLPIIKYMVYWSPRLKTISPSLVSLYVNKTRIAPNRTSCLLKNLSPDTTYFIQVEAVARHGDLRMKSTRTSEYITTYDIPNSDGTEPLTPVIAVKPDVPNLIGVHNLMTESPFFHENRIKCLASWKTDEGSKYRVEKYMLTWKLVTCGFQGDEKYLADDSPNGATTHAEEFYMYGFQYGCQYKVKVWVVDLRGVTGPITEAVFLVPQCHDILAKGMEQPVCPTIVVPRPPQKPRQLQHSIYVAGKNISAVVKWKIPHSDRAIEQFIVRWGQIIKTSVSDDRSKYRNKSLSEIDKDSIKELILHGNQHRIVLEQLRGDCDYAIELEAVSEAGQGTTARLEFSTPPLPSYHNSRTGTATVKPAVNESRPLSDSSQRPNHRTVGVGVSPPESRNLSSSPALSTSAPLSQCAPLTLIVTVILCFVSHCAAH